MTQVSTTNNPFFTKKIWPLLVIGAIVESLIFVFCYYAADNNIAETFRLSARYSGKLSFLIYLYCAYHFIQINNFTPNHITQRNSLLFAWLHFIHLGFLLTNLYLNDIEIVPLRLSGGVLAYLFILIYPFIAHKLKYALHLVYYYYVGLIMLLTFVARATGKFVGVTPNITHYAGIATTIVLFIWLAVKIFRRNTTSQ